jgi:hypothetical protein
VYEYARSLQHLVLLDDFEGLGRHAGDVLRGVHPVEVGADLLRVALAEVVEQHGAVELPAVPRARSPRQHYSPPQSCSPRTILCRQLEATNSNADRMAESGVAASGLPAKGRST